MAPQVPTVRLANAARLSPDPGQPEHGIRPQPTRAARGLPPACLRAPASPRRLHDVGVDDLDARRGRCGHALVAVDDEVGTIHRHDIGSAGNLVLRDLAGHAEIDAAPATPRRRPHRGPRLRAAADRALLRVLRPQPPLGAPAPQRPLRPLTRCDQTTDTKVPIHTSALERQSNDVGPASSRP